MWIQFKYLIIEYSYCKMPRNSPLNKNEKRQISAYKLEGKSIFYCKRTVEVPNSWEKLKNPESYLPENIQVVHLKLQMQPDVDVFEKLLKDNQAQEICKNLRIYPSLQE